MNKKEVMAIVHNFSDALEAQLKGFVIRGAEKTLLKISGSEFDALTLQNPTFAELARSATSLLQKVEQVVAEISHEDVVELKIFERVKEYAEILDQIAQSIVDFDDRLLIDCISHLEEFLHINK